MAPMDPSTQDITSDHEIDELLDATHNGEDIFDTNIVQAEEQQVRSQKAAGNVAELGVDEEVKIEKKRRPIPKLDDARLLSDPGVPKLRKISKERLKFKGKGHEYGDIARMLNMYQLWLDDLYPRAKFADGLAMIEKLGHSKRIQLMRKEWIDQGKPRHTTEQDNDAADAAEPDQSAQDGTERMEGVESEKAPQDQEDGERPEESLPDKAGEVAQESGGDVLDDEDDLDAWLAESEALTTSMTSTIIPPRTAVDEADDPFADEMEAMAEMEAMEAVM